MSCMYCSQEGTQRVPTDPQSVVCEKCWKLLQNPATALPLIRGHVTMSLRGKVHPDRLEEMVQAFMGHISTWKRPA